MRKLLLASFSVLCFQASAQDHFSAIATSQRVGLQNVSLNPAELANLRSKYEIQVLAVSLNVSNNKIGFNDIWGDEDFEDLIFRGTEAVDLRFDAEINGPGFAFRHNDWGFAITTKAHAKMDFVDVDVNIGDAIADQGILLIGSTTLSNNYNQRINGTTWGELGLSVARNFYNTEKHRLNAGATLKLLFPGSYANLGADKFTGTIDNTIGSSYLHDAQANLNIAYSGNLGENFTSFTDYLGSLVGGLNGFAADFGVNYQLKHATDFKYLLNAGLSLRNIGSMTFKDNNNASTNYLLEIPSASPGDPGLDLEQFEDVESLQEAEQILLQSGYLNRTDNESTDFKVKLPTVFSAYADVRVVPSFYVTLFAKQKLNDDSKNDQIVSENVYSLTPRYTINNFEIWSTWASNEISGISGGVGIRAYGFFFGSSSALTALIGDAKQGDFYVGYSFGLK